MAIATNKYPLRSLVSQKTSNVITDDPLENDEISNVISEDPLNNDERSKRSKR